MPTIAQLEKLLSIDPDDPFVHYGLAQEYSKEDDHTKALESYDKVIELDVNYCYAYYFKAQCLEALGRLDEAHQTIEDGVRIATEIGDAKALAELRALAH